MQISVRNSIRIVFIALTGLFSVAGFSQTSWYVSQQHGSDDHDGLSPSTPFKTVGHAVSQLQSGDTLLLMGEFTNEHYLPDYAYTGDINDPHIWLIEHTLKISGLHGSQDKYITLKSYDENTVLKGDGANIIRITNSSYLRLEGLEVYGEVEHIPLETARALQFLYRDPETDEVLYRVPPGTPDEEVEDLTLPVLGSVLRPTYTDTRGVYLSNVHHIIIRGNKIHHTPGVGLRVADCEYIDIVENEIHDCSRKSYSGTHALVVTKAASTDELDNYKINILRNKVHHNYNEIYSWSPQKSFITPRIDEGKGISLQRNNLNSWTHGRFLVANNISYWNGFSGVHTNDGKRMDFINNTCYMNSYTNTVTYAGQEQKGKNIGISAQSSEDINIINNAIYIDNAWGAHPISVSNTSGYAVFDNIIFGDNGPLNQDPDVEAVQVNTTVADPLFVDAPHFDFTLQSHSPAIGIANADYAPATDFFGNTRDGQPDLGAIEYDSLVGVYFPNRPHELKVYPNPFHRELSIEGGWQLHCVELYTLTGQCVHREELRSNKARFNLSFLRKGSYMLKINDYFTIVIKE